MKIVFTSCTNVQDFAFQPGWTRIAELQPDVLLLLGDQIYMDFAADLYAPKTMDLAQFVERMYGRYKNQWAVPELQALLESCPEMRIEMVWDDHDFAWNNACGGDPGSPPDDKHHVPDDKKWAARMLFSQYRSALQNRPAQYPPPPFNLAQPEQGLVPQNAGVETYFDLENSAVRVILLDNRYHRDCPGPDTAQIMDEAQWAWLRGLLDGNQEITLLCSGSTLTHSECWEQYPASYKRLLEMLAGKKMLMLSGDIHRNRFDEHQLAGQYPLFEATASGLAVMGFKPFKWLGPQQNFGLLDISHTTVKIDLFRKGSLDETHQLNRSTWK